MKSVQFIFGIHNHQPIGNFNHVIEQVYQQSYLPFIKILERHPSVAMVLHFSGCLLEWLEKFHPRYLNRINALVQRGNIEILSSAFYEPILAVIPHHDKIGQIKKMNNYISNRFLYTPKGLWLSERVWEPHLPKPIHEAGIEYIAVDDYHFLAAGKQLTELSGYFNTEEQGDSIGIFPINQRLRYSMPFQDGEVTLNILKEYVTEKGNNVVVMVDDGEKFGAWPGTHDLCYKKEKWLERFFSLLEDNQKWIKTTTFQSFVQSYPPVGRVYLPTTSYFEMGEWSLPGKIGEAFAKFTEELKEQEKLDQVRPFIRGGMWRNFLSMYSESNWMQRRMVMLSNHIHILNKKRRINKKIYAQIQNDLWKAQCNCAYWHGIFGGLYLPHLRHAIYKQLIKAEQQLSAINYDLPFPLDLDLDGHLEYTLTSNSIKIIARQLGGIIEEFDYLPKHFNLLNTLRRYPESYHINVAGAKRVNQLKETIHHVHSAKEPDLEKLLFYDTYPRKMLIDHFLPQKITIEQIKKIIPGSRDLNHEAFQVDSENPLVFSRTGNVFGQKIHIRKKINLNKSELKINISLTNVDNKTIRGFYGSELNFSMLGGHTPDRYYKINDPKPKYLDITAEYSEIESLHIVNEWDRFQIILKLGENTDIWLFPVETINMSESGFERVYQSSVIIPHWELDLPPHNTIIYHFSILVEEL